MTALLDATDSQMATLAGLVEALHVAEATVSSMHAARDGLLAMAGRLAIEIAKQGDHPDRGDHSIRTVAAEIAAVQRASDRTIERRMAAATVLVDLFPTVWAAQGTGRISAAHSRVITDAGSHLPDPARAEYAAILIPLAEHESPNRLRPLAASPNGSPPPRSPPDTGKHAPTDASGSQRATTGWPPCTPTPPQPSCTACSIDSHRWHT